MLSLPVYKSLLATDVNDIFHRDQYDFILLLYNIEWLKN